MGVRARIMRHAARENAQTSGRASHTRGAPRMRVCASARTCFRAACTAAFDASKFCVATATVGSASVPVPARALRRCAKRMPRIRQARHSRLQTHAPCPHSPRRCPHLCFAPARPARPRRRAARRHRQAGERRRPAAASRGARPSSAVAAARQSVMRRPSRSTRSTALSPSR